MRKPHAELVTLPQAPIALQVVSPTSGAARAALWAYTDDVASRYYRRQATDEEIAAALREDPSDDLALPHGLFLVAQRDAAVVGCAGLRLLPDSLGEVKRVFVAPAERGRGLGRQLMGQVEQQAREQAVTTLRLDTRADLMEACALYASLGYQQVPAFNQGRYAEHWFAKALL